MLATLTIKNVVLIETLVIDFAKNLCALTGETGAGKSILLDSLGLALGARSDSGLIRRDADKAVVTASFDLAKTHSAFKILSSNDVEHEGDLILKRVLTSDGRSKAFINDQAVSVSLLKSIGQTLVEIHGQFDTYHLMDASNHVVMLDEYAGHGKQLVSLKSKWITWRDLKKALITAQETIEQARADEEYYRQSLEDLDSLSPESGEEEKLSRLRERLMRREQILTNLNESQISLGDIEELSGKVWRNFERLGEEGKLAVEAFSRMESEMQEVLSAIADVSHDVENSEFSLTEIDDRLFALKAQARKFECEIDALPAKRDEIAAALNAIENQDADLAQMMRDVEIAKEAYEGEAQALSVKRQKAGEKIAKLVMKELVPLKLDKARFEVAIETLDENQWNINGLDKVEFLIATNPGAQAGSFSKIASGGELSRFTLALKVILAETGIAPSLVFDEVDSGIGGATAAAVGERLAKLATHKQILVVTHSPQVAATAHSHWIVSKSGAKDVKTTITPLDSIAERQEEIARMLAGAEITPEARAAAMKLLEAHNNQKAA